MKAEAQQPSRILCIDQFRGYAVLTMILVNFIGRFDVTPWMLRHHREGMSFNDTIAPIFIFVVGMSFRLSFLKFADKNGLGAARRKAARRYLLMTLLGFVIYFGYFWDALSDIGIGGLLALFLIEKSPWSRLGGAAVFLALYQLIFSCTGYGAWQMAHSLNGGPLGTLSWAAILLLGTVAYDWLASRDAAEIIKRCVVWGMFLSAAGWLLKVEWPHVKPAWPFTQYCMSAPYPLFATGLCFFTLLFFYLLNEKGKVRLPHLSVLGENPLVIYLLHWVGIGLGLLVLPNSARPLTIGIGFFCVYGFCYLAAILLHRKRIHVKF